MPSASAFLDAPSASDFLDEKPSASEFLGAPPADVQSVPVPGLDDAVPSGFNPAPGSTASPLDSVKVGPVTIKPKTIGRTILNLLPGGSEIGQAADMLTGQTVKQRLEKTMDPAVQFERPSLETASKLAPFDPSGVTSLIRQISPEKQAILTRAQISTAEGFGEFMSSQLGLTLSAAGPLGQIVHRAIGAAFIAHGLSDIPGAKDQWANAKTPEEKSDALARWFGIGAQIGAPAAGAFSGGEAVPELTRGGVLSKQQELAPETPYFEPKRTIPDEQVDGLHIARDKLAENFNAQPPAIQQARQVALDGIDEALLHIDRKQVNDSRARTAPPAGQTPPAAGEGTGIAPTLSSAEPTTILSAEEQAKLDAQPPLKEAGQPIPDEVKTKVADNLDAANSNLTAEQVRHEQTSSPRDESAEEQRSGTSGSPEGLHPAASQREVPPGTAGEREGGQQGAAAQPAGEHPADLAVAERQADRKAVDQTSSADELNGLARKYGVPEEDIRRGWDEMGQDWLRDKIRERIENPAAQKFASADEAHVSAYDLANRIGEDATRGQPDSVREAAQMAAYDNARSSIESDRENPQFNPEFMRRAAREAAGKEASRLGTSLDEPIGDEEGATGKDQVESPEPSPQEQASQKEFIDKAAEELGKLNENEQYVLNAKHVDGKNNAQIAEDLGLSRERVRQIYDEAVGKMRTSMEKQGFMRRGGGEGGAFSPGILAEIASAARKIPGAEGYADGWRARVSDFFKTVNGFRRLLESSKQRDRIPALYDSAETKAALVANQARNNVRLGTSELDRQAATFVQQAAGDRAALEAKLEAIRGKGYDKVIDHALANWYRLQKIADRAKANTDSAHEAATKSGMNLEYREGYAKGAHQEFDPHNGNVVFDAQRGGSGVSTSFTKPKVFNDYAESIAAGYKPKTLDLADLTQSAVLNTMRKVNRRAWVSALREMNMPDERPVIQDSEIITRPDGEGGIKQAGIRAPSGYRLLQIEPGSMVAVHADAYPLVSKLVDTSHFPEILSKTAGSIKHNILAFDIYHGSRFAQMQAAFTRATPSFRQGLATLEYSDADLTKAVDSGEITQKQAEYARENRPIISAGVEAGLNVGRISDALYKDVVPLFPFAKSTTNFIFNKLSRGIIAESYVYALKRNAGLHPEMSDADLHRFTAKEVNQYYRNLGNQGLLKSKTFQDGARFLMFAPQWLEGRLGSEARGYGQIAKVPFTGKLGNIGAGMATGLVAYFAAGQLINMLTRGQPTWKNPEPGHKLDAWIPDPMGSNGQFISPASVFAETAHDAMKMHERGEAAADIPGDLAKGAVGPVPRAAWDLLTGKDFYGRQLHGFDRITQAVKDVAPVPLALKSQGKPGSGERQALSFAGVKSVGAGSFSSNTYQLAENWMKENHITRPGAIEGEHGPASAYAPLKEALQMNDPKKASAELKSLRETVKPQLIDQHFNSLPSIKFTGRESTEGRFVQSLSPQEKGLYQKAIAERRDILNRYRELKKTIP